MKHVKIIAVALCSATISGLVTGSLFLYSNYKYQTDRQELNDYFEVIEYIEENYYNETDEEDYMNNALKGLVSGLGDDYANYMTPEEYKSSMENLNGSFAGIGVTITQNKEMQIEVIEILKNTPASKSDIKSGDIITAIDGVKTNNMTSSDVVKLVKGPVGTEVTLTLNRDGREFNQTLKREEIISETVEYQILDDNIAYIKITSFKDVTAEQFDNALNTVLSKGAEKIIYDLRNNGGGLLTACESMLDPLLPAGDVAYARFKDQSEIVICKSDMYEINIPTAILVNENTASASELFSSAMRDFDKAVLVGTKTFGKGIMQNTIPLSNKGGLTLTVAEYRTAKSECFHGEGLTPDYEVILPEGTDISKPNLETDTQLKKAVEILK